MIILLQVHNTLNFGHGCLQPMMKLRYIESKVLDVCATLFKCVYCKCRRRVMFILNYPLLNPLSSISQEMYHCCVKISQGKIESWEIFKIVLVKTQDLNEGCL